MRDSASKGSDVVFLIYFNTVMITGPESGYDRVTVKIGQNNKLKLILLYYIRLCFGNLVTRYITFVSLKR